MSKGVAKFILDIILERVYAVILENEKLLREAREKSGQLEAKSKQLERRNKLLETTKLSREYIVLIFLSFSIGSEFVEKFVEIICREIAFETYKINENAKNLSILVIMKALKIER